MSDNISSASEFGESLSPEEREMQSLLPSLRDVGRHVMEWLHGPVGAVTVKPFIKQEITYNLHGSREGYHAEMGVKPEGKEVPSEFCQIFFRRDDAGDLIAVAISREQGTEVDQIGIEGQQADDVGRYFEILARQYSIDPRKLALTDIPEHLGYGYKEPNLE